MTYIPEQGDIIYLDFDPQTGHEQKGKRPALVISNIVYNKFTRLSIVCPITSTDRNFPLHVRLDARTEINGVIMCEQIKALDIKSRNAFFVERAPNDIVEEVLDIVVGFVDIVKSKN